MVKDVIEFLVGYPFWVKAAVVGLAATVAFLLLAFRPDPNKSVLLRIERLETTTPYKTIALLVTVNGNQQRFPSGYNSVAYEQNMAGGDYPLPAEGDEVLIDIQATGQLQEDRRLLPTMPPHIVNITLEFRLRQPIRLSKPILPTTGVAMLRAVEGGVQRGPREYNIQAHYAVH